MLEEKEMVNLVIKDGKFIEVERVTQILKDGVEVGRSKHRTAYVPGQEMSEKDKADADIVAVKERFWTAEKVRAYRAEQAALEAAERSQQNAS